MTVGKHIYSMGTILLLYITLVSIPKLEDD